MLDEATKRGYEFARHVPLGDTHHELDLDGPDACASLSAADIGALFARLGKEANDAVDSADLAEAVAIQRQMLAMCVPRTGWLAQYPLLIMQRMIAVAAKMDAMNVGAACDIVRFAITRPVRDALDAAAVVPEMDLLADNCAKVGFEDTSAAVRRVRDAIAARC